LLLDGHVGQRFLEVQRFVYKSAGVEKLFDGLTTGLQPVRQLFIGGTLLLDMPGGICDAAAIQPGLGLLAGRTGGDIPEIT